MTSFGKLLTIVALLLSGCESTSSGNTGAGSGERPPPPPPPFPVPAAALPQSDSIALDLAVPAVVQAGDPVPLHVTVRNITRRHLQLNFDGAPPRIDFVVSRPDGTEVWRLRPRGGIVYDIMSIKFLAPGGDLAFAEAWDQRDHTGEPVPPGTYCVHAVVPVTGSDRQRERVTGLKPLLVSGSPSAPSTAECSASE